MLAVVKSDSKTMFETTDDLVSIRRKPAKTLTLLYIRMVKS